MCIRDRYMGSLVSSALFLICSSSPCLGCIGSYIFSVFLWRSLGCAHIVFVSALFLYFVVCAYRKVSYSDTLLNFTNKLFLHFYWLSFNVIIAVSYTHLTLPTTPYV
eukprot:TRINITY_DN17691_c0_g1_i1.p1 TRINITY_DN17691_c0_g1~~TRINITY_DN17691_c0_g1_i1.p1  ORF type:complete len:107 (-),score=13.47 TRINITY_DN17691_c0_g1_i1:34-354(-)